MHYEFHVANYSDEAIASVPVSIYFNTPDHALVEQGTTTVTNIPAGHYQALEFTFPGVVAGQWKMSMEANKPRAFEESNYENNLLSRIFTYVDKTELIAESVSAVDDDPKFDADGYQMLYYDIPTTLEFVLSNVSAIDASNVLVQVPAAFEDETGAYPAKLAETRMDVPAHTRRTLQLNINFNKPATAQIGLLLNNDRACDEVNHEIFSITKYNPSTGGEAEEIVVTGMPPCSYYAGGKEYFHPDSGMVNGDWNKDNDGENILKAIKAFYKAVFGVETDNTEKYAYSLYGSRTVTKEGDRFHGTYHLGVDVNKEQGAKVYSAHSGKLLEAKGNHIAIYDSEKDVTYFYLHTQIDSSIENNKDIDITKGTLLGKESNVGLGESNNYHLHFEVQSGRSTSPGIPSRELDN